MKNFEIIVPKGIKLNRADIVEQLKVDIIKYNIFAIGEVHGVADNADLYLTIFNEFNFDCIALEYPVDCLDDLIKFLKIGEHPKHWFFQEINDGRFNYEMLSVLKVLFDNKKLKQIICYDKRKNTTIWNEREVDYAEAFIEQYKPNLKTLIIGGGYHIRTEPFESEYEKGILYPMCYYLQKKYGIFPTSKITYASGEFFNYEKQKFEDKDIPEEYDLIKVEDYKYNFILRNVKSIKVD